MSEVANWDSEEHELPPRRLRIASRADRRQSGWDFFCQDPDDLYTGKLINSESRRAGYVSIWAGVFPSEAAFRLYVKEAEDMLDYPDGTQDFCPMWDDLGFVLPHESVKTAFATQLVPISHLIRRFPYFHTFMEPLIAACTQRRLSRTNAVVALYGLDHSDHQPLSFGYLRFIGSFQFC
jgi:hypothetical protein